MEITEAGSQDHQRRTTFIAKHPDTEITCDDITQKETALDDYRKAIEKKNDKHDNGAYDHVTQCDLAVYDNTGTYLMNIQDVQGINNPCLQGRFHEVFIVHETDDRGEGDVYTNMLSASPVLFILDERISGTLDMRACVCKAWSQAHELALCIVLE